VTELVSGRDFFEFVTSYRYTAFRLEVRDRYNTPSEVEPVRRFLAGEPDDDAWMDDWTGMVLRRTLAGQRMERVRIVTEPWSDYTRFGLHLARLNVAAGEEIRYLEREEASQLELPRHDFWLIDSRMVGILRFGNDDVLLGAEIVDDPAVVVEHCQYREIAQHHAVPRAAYIASKE
jgi:hypothetical protein